MQHMTLCQKFQIGGALIFLAIGIASIGYPLFGSKPFGVLTAVLSVALLFMNTYAEKLDTYCEKAQILERIFTDLTILYFVLEADTNATNIQSYLDKKLQLEREMRQNVISRQVFGSDFYAHVKMYWTKKIQTQWVVDALELKLIDKFPFSFFLLMVMAFLFGFGFATGYICINIELLKIFLINLNN